jgi:hypothetical protein
MSAEMSTFSFAFTFKFEVIERASPQRRATASDPVTNGASS